MRVPAFKFTKSARGYVVNTPASLSKTGHRTRQYFATQEEARGACTDLRNRFLNHGTSAPTLPPGQSDLATRAFRLLAGANHPDEAVLSAVKLYLDRTKAEAASVTFSKACEAYAGAKGHRTARHIADIRRLPNRFSAIAGKLVAKIEPAELEQHLDSLPGPMRNLVLRQTRAVLNFAVRRGWSAENPGNRVDLAHVPAPEVHLLTGEQLHFLMFTAAETDPDLCPLIATEAFAGVRPAEAEKLTWEDIDFDDDLLTVTAAAAKTRRARHISMHKTLRAWLDWHVARDGRDKGPITPATGTPLRRRLRALRKKAAIRLLLKITAAAEPTLHALITVQGGQTEPEYQSFNDLAERLQTEPNMLVRLHALREKAGIDPWPQDCLRHTFASASLASEWRDIGALCLDLGHTSQAMLHKHYHRAMRRAEGEAVFAVTPPTTSGGGKIVPLQWAA